MLDTDQAFEEGHPEPDDNTEKAGCGCYADADTVEVLPNDTTLCQRCFERAEHASAAFDRVELQAVVDRLQAMGPERLGNHDLYRRLMATFHGALALKRREAMPTTVGPVPVEHGGGIPADDNAMGFSYVQTFGDGLPTLRRTVIYVRDAAGELATPVLIPSGEWF